MAKRLSPEEKEARQKFNNLKITIKTTISNASWADLQFIFIPKIMERQTQQEQECETTIETNGVGLNGCDAEFITDLYNQTQKGKRLSEGQAKAARKVLSKYAGQYAQIAQAKTQAV